MARRKTRQPPATQLVPVTAAPALPTPPAALYTAPRTRRKKRTRGRKAVKWGASHVAAAAAGASIGTAAAAYAVHQDVVGPKTAGWLMIGGGSAITAAGHYWQSPHIFAAGAGTAFAGVAHTTMSYVADRRNGSGSGTRNAQLEETYQLAESRVRELEEQLDEAYSRLADD